MTTKKPHTKRNLAIVGVGAFLLGIAFGAASSGDDPPKSSSQPKPAPAVTVTAEPEIVEVDVGGTPEACVTALDRAEEIFLLNAEVFSLSASFLADTFPTAIEAAANWDVPALEAATEDLEGFTAGIERAAAKVEKIDYNGAADECRGEV